jgi:hypothetical protein
MLRTHNNLGGAMTSGSQAGPAGQATDLTLLYFGRDDAETDITDDGLLQRSFLKTDAYQAILTGRKSLILGRKGSGKSAICRNLQQEPPPGFAIRLVTPDEISAEEIRTFELDGITPEQAKALVWRYVYAVELAKFVVAHAQDQHTKRPDSVKHVGQFLKENGEGDGPGTGQKFWKILERLRSSLSLEAFGVKIGLDVSPSQGLRVSNQLEVVEDRLKEAVRDLKCPKTHTRVLLLVDQVEKVWNDDPQSDRMVTGLLLASKHVAAEFPPSRCAVFLRADIYELLRFTERDKFRGDEIWIEWTDRGLETLVATRAAVSVGRAVGAAELWGNVFPAQVEGVPIQRFLVDHTLMRPRELIQLCNLCRDTAAKNGQDRITEADVLEAVPQYSSWKLQDLISEYRVNYPFLFELLVPFQNSAYVLTRAQVDDRFALIQEALQRRYPRHAALFHPDVVMDLLFSIGFLGVLRNGQTVFCYLKNPGSVQPADSSFVIQRSFRYALRSTSALDVRPYESRAASRAQYERLYSGLEYRGSPGRQSRVLRTGVLGREVRRHLDRVGESARAADLPDEIRAELWLSLVKMARDIDGILDADEPELLPVCQDISATLRQFAERLQVMPDLAARTSNRRLVIVLLDVAELFASRDGLARLRDST